VFCCREKIDLYFFFLIPSPYKKKMKIASEIFRRIMNAFYIKSIFRRRFIRDSLYFVEFSISKKTLTIFNIWFDESIRGEGIFTSLLSRLETFCKYRNMNITIDNVINMKLKAFLVRRGFKIVGKNLEKSFYSIFWIIYLLFDLFRAKKRRVSKNLEKSFYSIFWIIFLLFDLFRAKKKRVSILPI
jgi:hypothetical protein